MANLSITSECNRSCAYCFARSAFRERGMEGAHISLALFREALDFLERSGIDQVRLVGGEPTLHPEFPLLVREVMARGMRLLVFTNGLGPGSAFEELADAPMERVDVLINMAEPGETEPGEKGRQEAVLKKLGPRVILGINIHKPAVRLDFLPDLIDRFTLSRTVRLGLAHPSSTGSARSLHPRCYSDAGRRILSFAAMIREREIDLMFDCGFVPCMFPEGGLELIGKTSRDIGRRCNPLPDILPDGAVIPCYPLAGVYHEPSFQHLDSTTARARLEKKMAPRRTPGIFRVCSTCLLKRSGECSGGCLAATMTRLRSGPFSFSMSEKATERKRSPVHFIAYPGEQPVDDASSHHLPRAGAGWVIPYVDQPLSFWEQLADRFRGRVKEVYFPLPGDLLPSGRPEQPAAHLEMFLRESPFPLSTLVNPAILPRPAEEMAGPVVDELKRLAMEFGVSAATVSNLTLAEKIRHALPDIHLTASTLMDIYLPNQVLMLHDLFENLVPASRIMRDVTALKVLKEAFPGRIRLMVNEACLPACPFRAQHFFEMGSRLEHPKSLCNDLLERRPWMRLTGAWVTPRALHLYDGLYDDLKMAGRVTLRDPDDYMRILDAYVHGKELTPDQIGGGPASVQEPMRISEAFFARTLTCGKQCHACDICRDYYEKASVNGDDR